ncbi:hypothetical protein QWZ08_00305 [Ferruginibacter paludis]|uniref:hypothetical protein n=1 Tax=Ferruginibacter paludis TaxID=1310417 RepID=UPI0025B4A8D2|nr:hypothetical protein [Ferruginibacter paludis]MDN3654042.1 hypothetical protein [Ferruginibacter paludis]
MVFLFYRFHWKEWSEQQITDEGTGLFYTNRAPDNLHDLQRSIKLFAHKPVTALLTIECLCKISKATYEVEQGKPFYLSQQ